MPISSSISCICIVLYISIIIAFWIKLFYNSNNSLYTFSSILKLIFISCLNPILLMISLINFIRIFYQFQEFNLFTLLFSYSINFIALLPQLLTMIVSIVQQKSFSISWKDYKFSYYKNIYSLYSKTYSFILTNNHLFF